MKGDSNSKSYAAIHSTIDCMVVLYAVINHTGNDARTIVYGMAFPV